MAGPIKWTIDVKKDEVRDSVFALGCGPVDDQVYYTQQWYRLTQARPPKDREAKEKDDDFKHTANAEGADDKTKETGQVKTEKGKWVVSSAARREQDKRLLAVGRHFEVIMRALEFYRDYKSDLEGEETDKVLEACAACQAATDADWKKFVEKRLRQVKQEGRELKEDEKWLETFLDPHPTTWALESMPGYPGLREEATRFTPPDQVMRAIKKE